MMILSTKTMMFKTFISLDTSYPFSSLYERLTRGQTLPIF